MVTYNDATWQYRLRQEYVAQVNAERRRLAMLDNMREMYEAVMGPPTFQGIALEYHENIDCAHTKPEEWM